MLSDFTEKQQSEFPQLSSPQLASFDQQVKIPRFFDYAFAQSPLKTITQLIDTRIHPDIDSEYIAQARHQVFGLVTGLVMLPAFSLLYALGGGSSWIFHLVMLAPFSMRLSQFLKMPKDKDIDAQINSRQRVFGWQLLILTFITGGVVSPAFPWFISVISQAAISQRGAQQLRQINQIFLFVAIATIATFIPFLPNVIPEPSRLWLLSSSIILVVIQTWGGHSILYGQRIVREELASVMRLRELETSLVRDESTRHLLTKLSRGGGDGMFGVLRLDLPIVDNSVFDSQLIYNKQRLAEALLNCCPEGSVFAALGKDRVVIFFPKNQKGKMASSIEKVLHAWPKMAISSCGLYEQCRAQNLTEAIVFDECGVG